MATALISLGSNLGDRAQQLARAAEQLAAAPGIELLAVSAASETAAIGGAGAQPAYLNAAARLETSLPPAELLQRLHSIEQGLGRVRVERWEARTIDLDLLLYEEHQWQTAELELPHPRMAFRRFVIEPAAEVAADMVHPVIGWTVARLAAHLREAPPHVAFSGAAADNAAAVAAAVAAPLIGDPAAAGRAAAAGSSSGRTLEQAVECLSRRASTLDRARCSPVLGVLLSAFWIDDTLSEFAELPPRQQSVLEALWQAVEPFVVPAKLVVVGAADAQRALARRRQRGPTLVVADAPSAAARDEVIAAIAAMS